MRHPLACTHLAMTLLLCLGATACGGGGSGGVASANAATAAADNPTGGSGSGVETDSDSDTGDSSQRPDIEMLTGIQAASRLASRASFGLSYKDIQTTESLGEEAWLDQQIATPASFHDGVVSELLVRQQNGEFDSLFPNGGGNNQQAFFGRIAWWHTTVSAPDQLRQRVAYALSQIFVISDEVTPLFVNPYATSNFYDMLLRNAFGNFRDLLYDVTLHPSMGLYLSHLNNAKGDPETGTFPDENYAREVMQLFSIGLFELNSDGTEILQDGMPVPTYDNTTIGEFAKVFTGLTYAGVVPRFGANRFNFREPMAMVEEFHDTSEKVLLNGTILSAGQDGIADIEAAVDNLFQHQNVGPFIGKQLIQRLVSSNPSPAYVQRVAEAFADNGAGVRGDMAHVIKQVLLDPEARALPETAVTATPLRGKLREPLLRYTAMLRQLGITSADGFYANTGFFVQERIQQHALAAPSVFNFYLPAHQPVGEIAALGLVAPEFQITNTNSIIEISNLMQAAVIGDFNNDVREAPFSASTLSLDGLLDVADDTQALLDRLDMLFTYGTLSAASRANIETVAAGIEDPELRVRAAAFLLLISPDYAVEL
ncbi:MAG: DUF1800 domain-containing protein [Congregibacter sp.]